MKTNQVHLEHVTRSLRLALGFTLVSAASLLGMAVLAGLPLALGAATAIVALAVGIVSGGFGLAARIPVPSPEPGRRAAGGGQASAPLRVAHTR